MKALTEQLPGFIFYLGAGGVLLLIVGCLEAYGERFSAKRREETRRRALRARAWAEISELEEANH
jgi:hypothetical protein